jgi:hypothetical protein
VIKSMVLTMVFAMVFAMVLLWEIYHSKTIVFFA